VTAKALPDASRMTDPIGPRFLAFFLRIATKLQQFQIITFAAKIIYFYVEK
jgi:hypothetical protein